MFDRLGYIPQEEDPMRSLVPMLKFLTAKH